MAVLHPVCVPARQQILNVAYFLEGMAEVESHPLESNIIRTWGERGNITDPI